MKILPAGAISHNGVVSGKTHDFTFVDLFAGIGGMRLGFERINGKCVFTSEWNKFSQLTYRSNFRCEHEIAGDITGIHADDIPSHDVLLAGFPCQPFSIAGVSKKKSLGRAHGFLDKSQGTLFFDVARIIERHRPAAFLLENVKNLLSHDNGNTFNIICRTLREDLGYFISWKIIDGNCFVPQHRERIYIVGFRNETDFNFDAVPLPEKRKWPTLKSILHEYDKKSEFPYTDTLRNVSRRYTLSPKLWSYLKKYAEKHRAKGNGFGFGLFTGDMVARTLSARYYKDGSEILIKQSQRRPRRLTPRECARLMGFDIKGMRKFNIPVSDTQAYRQFGNAVVVPVVEHIATCMKANIMQVIDRSDLKRATG